MFLAAATHRLVEWTDGAVADRWLGVTVRQLPATAGETRRCRIGGLSARCEDGAGRGFATISPFPIVPLHPGVWTDPD